MASDHQVALARVHRGASTHLNRPARQVVPAFLQKLYEMVNDSANNDLIRWSDAGDSFLVLDHERFAREVLGRWFKHQNFSSFVRQLNMYGFHKIPHLQQGVLKSETDTEYWHFEHPNFHRGQPDLLCLIQRKKQAAQGGEDVAMDVRDASHIPAPTGNLSAGQILDINSIVNGIAAIKRHQTTISADLNELKNSNQLLWQEALTARERHKKHQDTINRILKFLAGVFGHSHGHVHKEDDRSSPSRAVVPRQPQRLMIGDGRQMKADAVDISGVLSGESELRDRFAREKSPFSSTPYSAVETPLSAPSPSIAPSEVFSQAPTDTPMLTPISEVNHSSAPPSVAASNSNNGISNNGIHKPSAEVDPSSQAGPSHAPYSSQQPNPSSSTSLMTTSPPPNTDAALQLAFAQMLQSPDQLQRLLAALSSSQPSYPIPDHPPPEAPDPQPLARYTHDYSLNYNPESANTGFIPQSSVPLLSPPSPNADVASLDPLINSAANLQKTYKDASEIDADVNALHSSINSLIESLGLDPSLIPTSSSHVQDTHPQTQGAPVGAPTEGMTPASLDGAHDEPSSAPDFDFDAFSFLTDFSRDGDQNADYGEFADRLDSAQVTGSSPRNDTSNEQYTAFLDEVASQSDAASPVIGLDSPESRPLNGNRKRKSDIADLVDEPITETKDTSIHNGIKAKRRK